MKTKHLLICFLVVVVLKTANAQTYYPLPTQNAYWTVYEWDELNYVYDDKVYSVEGDTLINGIDYTKIYKLNDYPTIYDTVRTLHCFMRQDNVAKKIWFIRHYLGETTEKLGYDLSVNVGDTVSLPAFDYGNVGDSIYVRFECGYAILNNGEFRQQLCFGGSTHPIQFIEGICSINNTFPDRLNYWDPFHQSYTMCMELNNIFIWPVGQDTTRCGFNFVDIDDYESNVLNLFPNPANNYINIDIPANFTKGSFELTDLMGNQLKKISFFNSSTQIQINLSPYPSGIYIFVTRTLTSIYYNKLIINH